jgi:hypothetical protein
MHGSDLEGNSARGYLDVVSKGDQLLIKHAFPAQRFRES